MSLGERELEVMTYLWAERSGTAAEVRAGLSDPLAYTTVLTILRNLEGKGFVRRIEEGRAHRYLPRVEAMSAQRSAVRRLVDTLFGGSAEDLLTHLVSERALSPDELGRIAKRLSSEGATKHEAAKHQAAKGDAAKRGTRKERKP